MRRVRVGNELLGKQFIEKCRDAPGAVKTASAWFPQALGSFP
jgi:hypothetical protein